MRSADQTTAALAQGRQATSRGRAPVALGDPSSVAMTGPAHDQAVRALAALLPELDDALDSPAPRPATPPAPETQARGDNDVSAAPATLQTDAARPVKRRRAPRAA
ncbi:hypothetical protein ACFP2E_08765 [Nocardioides sp. GCM10027114]